MSNTYLILDMSNLLYQTFFSHTKESEDINFAVCHSSALYTLRKYYNEHDVTDVVMAFDDYSWRKLYTKDLTQCVTHKKYKGNRRQNLTESEQKRLDIFDEHVRQFYTLMKEHTGAIVLKQKYLEADDLIAGFIQQHPEDEHILISADKDFMQLINKNVVLIDPGKNKVRKLDEYDNDPELFMFVKCIRGDANDNVQSSYPRIHKKKLLAAYKDEFALNNLMQHTFEVADNDESGNIVIHSYKTADLYEENQMLMDLRKQPEIIRNKIIQTIEDAKTNRNKFSYFEFVKFCGKYDLKDLLQNVDKFTRLLSGKKK